MRRFKTDILIRNNRLALMQQDGLHVDYEILSDTDYILELKRKMVEEANEVLSAHTADELKSELVDVLEVVDHLMEINRFDRAELNQLKVQKQQKIGKFDNKIKTHFVEMPDNHKDIAYYTSKPEKYPEIK